MIINYLRPINFITRLIIDISLLLFSEFKQSFHMFDQNGDGKITLSELGNVMRTLGQNPSESDLKQMIRELDSNSECKQRKVKHR